jgi:4-nitrophenyl phosphatase
MSECEHIHPDPEISAVLIGMDLNINYKKLAKAYTYLRNPATKFIATNADLTYPCNGTTFPGTGSLVSCLISSSGRQPTIVGKPNQTMMDVIVDKYKLDRSRTLMVGDRLDTDILFGITGGCATMLVLSGVTKAHTMETSEVKPTVVVDSLGSIFEMFQ